MVRFATIGSNFIVDLFLEAARFCPDFELAAVYSRTQERGEEFARKHNAPRVLTDLSALASDPEIDAVYVASPNLCHKDQAISLLLAGKHVLCEKPMGIDSAQVAEMYAAAEKGGAVLMEAMRPAHSPGLTIIRDTLPRLGTLRRVTMQFCQYSSRYDKFRNGIIENAFNPTLANGALMDIGIYCIHAAEFLFGMPQSVQGVSTFLHNGVDGQGTLLLQYPDMICELLYSKITRGEVQTQLQGEDGALLIDAVSIPQKLTLLPRGGQAENIAVSMDEGGDMLYEIRDFVEQVKAGAIDPVFRRHSENSTRILDEARRQMGVTFTAR